MTEIVQVLQEMGAAGSRLDQLHAVEASAGNISVALQAPSGVEAIFTEAEPFTLPVPAPALKGWTVLVTGSGCRLRDIAQNPGKVVACVEIAADGVGATLRFAPERGYAQPTSEFNSHLAVHNDQVAGGAPSGHGVVHAQPPYIVTLSHHKVWQSDELSRRIMRWEPETVVMLPDGVAALPYMVPGSETLRSASVAGLRDHRVVIWSKHGLLVRSEMGPAKCVDLIEYVETGAMYDHFNTCAGSPSQGLTDDELRAVIDAFKVDTALF